MASMHGGFEMPPETQTTGGTLTLHSGGELIISAEDVLYLFDPEGRHTEWRVEEVEEGFLVAYGPLNAEGMARPEFPDRTVFTKAQLEFRWADGSLMVNIGEDDGE